MKTAIVYYSKHHGNTLKLLEAIKAADEVTLIDVTKDPQADVSGFDRIGFASGIYYSNVAKQILKYAKEHLPEGKEVFFIGTCGNNSVSAQKTFFKALREITDGKKCKYLNEYICLGYDTYGPFKLVGGIAKGHPTEDEISASVSFYGNL